jgi:amino acid adenylation domain-containing protein
MDIGNAEGVKISNLGSQIDNLSPAKLALLSRRLKTKKEKPEQPTSIPRRQESRAPGPLSFAQERLWFIEQLNPGNPGFNLFGSFRSKGMMNPEVYRQVINEIARRQEILRTTFPVVDSQPVQAIGSSGKHSVPIADLSVLSEIEQAEIVRRLSSQERSRPFDLTREIPLRTTILSSHEGETILLLTVHHIIADAWSWDQLLGETQELYRAFSIGIPSMLIELPIQYADYAQWQRQWLEGEILEKQISYWKERLTDNPPLLELPTDRSRAGQQVYHSERQGILLDRPLTEAIQTLANQEGVTLFMMLLTAFYILLYRYTGQPDISVGTVISTRNHSEIERLIGLFINTLILRTKLDSHQTFRELVRQVRLSTVGAYAHSEIPIEKILEGLQPNRSLGFAPMFRVMFGLNTTALPGDMEEVSGLDVQRTDGVVLSDLENHPNARRLESIDTDLGLSVQEMENQLYVGIRYNSVLFDAGTVRKMLRHYQSLLESVIIDPNKQVATLCFLSHIEEQQLLIEWNDTESGQESNQCITGLFLSQREQTPDAIAVAFDDQQVTYRELNRRANHLAHQLRNLGIGPEPLISVVASRGIDFLTAMLAVFKVGGAYLPVDPSTPPRRLHQVLTQSHPSLVLVSDDFRAVIEQALQNPSSDEHLPVQSMELLLKHKQSMEDACHHCAPQTWSYVIYTSGSTGVPKGAIVEQAGMLNHLYAKISELHLTGADVVAQTASQSFDISVWQFLAILLVGGRIRIFNDESVRDPSQLLKLVECESITILEIVPSLLRAIVQNEVIETNGNRPNLTSLRRLLVTGDALPLELCHQWANLYPGIGLLNAYGPTECSDDVTHYSASQCLPADMVHLPIGRPICNTDLYSLGIGMTPVPIGVHGELFVGGIGVGRGYLDDPERTAEVFVPDPFSRKPGARLYRTGDLARYLPDGNLEFRGRIDHQVKIRGFRIELGEIEMTLNQHPAVRQAVVSALDDKDHNKRLLAYVVPDRQPAPTPNDLYEFLRNQLPDYMVPAVFMLLPEMPLTSNGKIDRLALPPPDENQSIETGRFEAPESQLEMKLAEIWSNILEIGQIGIYDNFFQLGGHSIMAIQLINRINQAFKINLSVRNVFEEPTIAGLALLIEETLIQTLEEESIEE